MAKDKNKFTDDEIDELRKSLTVLGLEQSEVDSYINKAKKTMEEDDEEKEESEGSKEEEEQEGQKTIEEQAKAESNEEDKEKEEGKEKIEKCNMPGKKAELMKKIKEIQKSIDEIDEEEAKKGSKKDKEVEKSINDEFGLEKLNDIEKSFGERFDDIEKAFNDKLDEQNVIFEDIKKSIDDLSDEVKRVANTPIPLKASYSRANFFEKGVENNLDKDEKVYSISKDKDELIKSMQDMLEVEKDEDIKTVLSNGISDYTINSVPTTDGAKALAILSRKKNITLER